MFFLSVGNPASRDSTQACSGGSIRFSPKRRAPDLCRWHNGVPMTEPVAQIHVHHGFEPALGEWVAGLLRTGLPGREIVSWASEEELRAGIGEVEVLRRSARRAGSGPGRSGCA
jgi:hypothetical protein